MIEEVVRDSGCRLGIPIRSSATSPTTSSLTDEEKELIYKWVAAGAPEGDPKDLPEPKQYAGSWMMPGGPDVVFHMTEEPVDVPAEGTVDYRYYVVDTGFTEDKWVKVAECMPDNRGVVHHMIVFMKPPGTDCSAAAAASDAGGAAGATRRRRRRGRQRVRPNQPTSELTSRRGSAVAAVAAGGRGGGQASFGQLCGFAPGTRPYVLPDGMAKLIPAGWQLVFQMHYTPNGSPQKDRSSVGIKFADPADGQVSRGHGQRRRTPCSRFRPATRTTRSSRTRTYGRDVLMLSVFPHMHLRGKDFHYELIYPDGSKETMLNMPRYDFNWQTSYVFAEPKKLPAGHDAALHGALRQLGRQSGQSRSDQAGALGRSDLGRNDDRLVRHRRAQGLRTSREVLPPQTRGFSESAQAREKRADSGAAQARCAARVARIGQSAALACSALARAATA